MFQRIRVTLWNYFIIITYMLALPAAAKAQVVANKWQWSTGAQAGVSHLRVTDRVFSTLPYTTTTYTGGIFVRAVTKRMMHLLRADFSQGNLTSDKASGTDADELFANASYHIAYRFGQKALQAMAGLGIGASFTERTYSGFINRGSSFERQLWTGVTAGLHYQKNADAHWVFEEMISVPLLTQVQQPELGAESSSGTRVSEWCAPGSLFRLSNTVSVRRVLTTRHHITLGYNWDFYAITLEREVRHASHRLVVGYQYNFGR